jgi:hypothetical protein
MEITALFNVAEQTLTGYLDFLWYFEFLFSFSRFMAEPSACSMEPLLGNTDLKRAFDAQ